jgi:hypothetical protein
MPLVAPVLSAAVTVGIFSGGLIGPSVPQLGSGIGQGIALWVKQLKVITVDTGAIGAGKGLGPLVIPQPLLLGSLLMTYATNGQLGVMAPLEALGITNGLIVGFSQGLVSTTHPSVGAGAAVARVIGPPAFSSLMQGFSSAGITGSGAVKKANAISMALTIVLQTLALPIAIAGAAGPSPSSGSGFGSII